MNFLSQFSSRALQASHRSDTMLARETNMAHVPVEFGKQFFQMLRGWLHFR